MKTATVRLTMDGGRPGKTASGLAYGPFVIHPSLEEGRVWSTTYWSLTHAATGLSADTYAPSSAAALQLARALVRCGANWNFRDATKWGKRSKRAAYNAVLRWRKEQPSA